MHSLTLHCRLLLAVFNVWLSHNKSPLSVLRRARLCRICFCLLWLFKRHTALSPVISTKCTLVAHPRPPAREEQEGKGVVWCGGTGRAQEWSEVGWLRAVSLCSPLAHPPRPVGNTEVDVNLESGKSKTCPWLHLHSLLTSMLDHTRLALLPTFPLGPHTLPPGTHDCEAEAWWKRVWLDAVFSQDHRSLFPISQAHYMHAYSKSYVIIKLCALGFTVCRTTSLVLAVVFSSGLSFCFLISLTSWVDGCVAIVAHPAGFNHLGFTSLETTSA